MSNICWRARTPAISSFTLHFGPALWVPIEPRCFSAPRRQSCIAVIGPLKAGGLIRAGSCALSLSLSASPSSQLICLSHSSCLSIHQWLCHSICLALALFCVHFLFVYFRYHITTVTKIPSGGGLGGGSKHFFLARFVMLMQSRGFRGACMCVHVCVPRIGTGSLNPQGGGCVWGGGVQKHNITCAV